MKTPRPGCERPAGDNNKLEFEIPEIIGIRR